MKLKLFGELLPRVHDLKFLGATFDSHLTFNAHVISFNKYKTFERDVSSV
jgi:hypothetical protein